MQVVYEALQDASHAHCRCAGGEDGRFCRRVHIRLWRHPTAEKDDERHLRRHRSALSIAANRISHRLNLSGPSYSVDTACSSSLVALDLACWNLRRGALRPRDCRRRQRAAEPGRLITFSRPSMLSPDGPHQDVRRRGQRLCARRGRGRGGAEALSDAHRRRRPRSTPSSKRPASTRTAGRPTLTVPEPDRQEEMLRTLCGARASTRARSTMSRRMAPARRWATRSRQRPRRASSASARRRRSWSAR